MNTFAGAARLARMKRLVSEASSPRQKYDEIVHLLIGLLGLPYGWIHLREEHSEWVPARLAWADGPWPGAATPFEALLQRDGQPVLVEDATQDERLAAHPLVAGPPNLRLCVAMPLSMRGQRVGTFCACGLQATSISAGELARTHELANSVIEMLLPLR